MSQQRIGSYQILEEIASGGQATVYRAWDVRSGQVVALKVMHPHLTRDTTYVERFQREARLAAATTHANIIRIFEVGQEGNTHFMALEYLPLSLGNLIQAQGGMPIERVVDIIHQVALGLEAAHQEGIVHRDIKPQNILIASDGTAKITDFGISRMTDLATMTRTGAVMGMPHYMAPEQARGQRVDIRSDIYSTGIALYQMLSGELPFDAETPWEVIRMHVDARPPLPDAHRAGPGPGQCRPRGDIRALATGGASRSACAYPGASHSSRTYGGELLHHMRRRSERGSTILYILRLVGRHFDTCCAPAKADPHAPTATSHTYANANGH